MKGLVTLCFVISWTVICGAVLAQNEVDYESDKSQDDLEELSRLLKEEELFKTNLKRIYDALNADDDDVNKDVEVPCGKFKCSTKTSKCGGDAETFYCQCKEGYKPKTGDEINNKESCVEYEKCPDETLRCNTDTTKCNGDADAPKCECLEGFEEVKDEEGSVDKERCIDKYKCENSDCQGQNQKCVPKGNDHYCECDVGFELEDKGTKGEKEIKCKALPYVCTGKECPTPSTKCATKGTDFVCECETGYKLKEGKTADTNKEACEPLPYVCTGKECPTPSTKCATKGTDFICECESGYKLKEGKTADTNKEACEQKNKCDLGKFACPRPERAKCVMIGDEDYYCECLPGFVPKEGEVKKNKGECTSGCDKNFCQHESTCKPKGKDYECECPLFWEGKNCSEASCAKSPCQNNGNCEVKGKDPDKKAECTCKDPFTGRFCETNLWCDKKICGTSDDVECKFSENFGVGYCHCKNDTEKFNYARGKCEEKPVCSYLTCQENEVCDAEAKQCKCQDRYELEKESGKCKAKPCESDCFTGSECSVISNDVIKCTCNSSQYYLNKECEDASCLLQNLRSNCERDCPHLNMKREGGICKPVKQDEGKTIIPCGLSCGKYGYCYKEDKQDAEERCVCEPEGEQKDEKSACELRKSVCPSGVELTKDKTKCNCTGQFKESANKITCELKTCSDKDVQNECKKQNAVCEMDWKNGVGYDCKCKEGYYKDPKSKICLYKTNVLNLKVECSKDNKVAFMDERGQIVCMCPPGIKTASNKPCTEKYDEKTTYLINNLPISKTKYVHGSMVDVFALTKDVISAMKNTFKDLIFARLYKYNVKDDVIDSSIWLQFEKISEFDYNRIPLAVFDDGLLPPGLQLKKENTNEVKGERLTFCSGQEHDLFCGATTCDKGECKCSEGYKIIDSSVRKYNIKKGAKTEEVTLFNCEDINECNDGSHTCPLGTTSCVNTEGSFYCKCLQKYKLKKDKVEDKNQEGCIDACKDPNPCTDGQGQCSLTSGGMIDCSCNVGFSGSYCNKKDVVLAGANKKTVIVGAVLGTFLGILILAVIAYVVKQRKNSHSEDFSPAPRLDNAEMTERRPMRGISNRAYQ